MVADYEVGSIVGRMKAEASGWSSTVEKMVTDCDKLEARFKALGGIGAALAVGAGIFIGAGIKQNATIERLSVSYRVLLKDAKAANDAMSYVRKLADSSPYQMEETLEAGRSMLAFGLDLRTYMTDAMNLASAMSAPLNEVVRALGRIKSGDFGEAFERLRDFGISRELLEGKGLVFDRSGSYQGSVDQALAAIQSIIRERFGGMVQEQAETWDGIISTILDKIKSLTADATADMFSMLKGPLKALRDWLEGLDEPAAKAIGSIVQLLGVFGALVATGSAIVLWGKKVSAAISGVGLAAKTLLTNPIFLAIAAVVGLVMVIGKMKASYDQAKKAAEERANAAQNEERSQRELLEACKNTERQLKNTTAGTAEHKRLEAELQAQMQKIGQVYPGVVTAYDEMNRVRGISVNLLEREVAAQEKLHGKGLKVIRLHRQITDVEADIKRFEGYLAQAETGQIVDEDPRYMVFLSKKYNPEGFSAFVEQTRKDLAQARKRLPQLKKEQDALFKSLNPEVKGGGGQTSSNDREKRASAIREIRDKILDALNETEKREIASLNDRYAEYEKLGLKTIEVDGETYTLQEAKATEMAALRRKYESERQQLNEQALAEIEQQTQRELAFAENLQRDLLQLQKDGQEKELQLLDLEKANEEKNARETIQDQARLDQALADIDAKYALRRKEITDRYAREAAETREKIETGSLEYQHEYALISDEEYHRRRIALARDHAERMKAEHGAESAEYQEALSAVAQAEYDAIVVREGLEKELTKTTLEEIRKRLEAELLATDLTGEKAAAIMAALARVNGMLGDLAEEEAEKAKENFETVKSSIQSGLSTLLKDFTSGEKTIAETWRDMLDRMLDSFIDFVSKLAAEKFALWLFEKIPGLATLSMESGGIVPGLSVASAAGGMMTGSFAGGLPAILHEKEMVLPKPISQFILDTMDQARGGDGQPVNFNITAMDSQDVQRALVKNRDTILGILGRDYSGNGPTRRGGR